MAHFAELDENNAVLRVIVVDDGAANDDQAGQTYCANDVGLGGRWVQTSYHATFRNYYAGVGFIYDETTDVFVPPQPWPSWVRNSTKYGWEAPVPQPEGSFYWDEPTLAWIAFTPTPPITS